MTDPRSPGAPLRRRRQILRRSAPLLVLAVVIGVKLLVMSGAAQVTRTAFEVGNQEAAALAARNLGVVNVVERYKAPFDAGTVAAAAAEDLADLRRSARLLRTALDLAPADGQCAVRVNLAVVLEAAGDAAGTDRAEAARLYRAAVAVARAAPPSCKDVRSATAPKVAGKRDGEQAPDPGGRTAADDLVELAAQSDRKAQAAGAEQAQKPKPDPVPEQSAPAAPDRDAALAGRAAKAESANQEAQEQKSADGAGGTGDGTPDVPTPW